MADSDAYYVYAPRRPRRSRSADQDYYVYYPDRDRDRDRRDRPRRAYYDDRVQVVDAPADYYYPRAARPPRRQEVALIPDDAVEGVRRDLSRALVVRDDSPESRQVDVYRRTEVVDDDDQQSGSDDGGRRRRRHRHRHRSQEDSARGSRRRDKGGDDGGNDDSNSGDGKVQRCKRTWYSMEEREKAGFFAKNFDSSYDGLIAALAGGALGAMTVGRFAHGKNDGPPKHRGLKVAGGALLGAAAFNVAENWYSIYTEEEEEDAEKGRRDRRRERQAQDQQQQ